MNGTSTRNDGIDRLTTLRAALRAAVRVVIAVLPLVVTLVLPAPATAADRTLFDALGGERVLHAAVDRFADLVVADDRINFTFADADMGKFKALLYEQLCELAQGPCHYPGRDMKTAHAKLNLNVAEFNALAEDLYLALGRSGVAYREQNKLMALLAPMQRDIVRRR